MIEKTSQDSIQAYLEDASGLNGAHCEKVFIPENESEVSEILREASQKNEPVTISGGGTGVTGGRLPFGGTVLSLEKLNKVLQTSNGSMTVQPGVPLTDIHAAAEKTGQIYPPDATEWTALIGGNIATNASGARTFKYGATRLYIDRIKVVLASGDILDIPRGKYFADGQVIEVQSPKSKVQNKIQIPDIQMPNIKNAAGYYSRPGMDLIDLFIGSEGTLGVITEAELGLIPKRGYTFACFAFFEKMTDAVSFVDAARKASFAARASGDTAGLDALALEFFDKNALRMLGSKYPKLPSGPEAVVFFEEEITPERENRYLDDWGTLLEKNNVSLDDVWSAVEPEKEAVFKEIRHSIPELVNEIVKKRGFPKAGTDIAVPSDRFKEMFDYYLSNLTSNEIDHLIFGHIGDCHLHANMLPNDKAEELKVKELYLDFARKAVSLGGTVSAEHGIGKLKHHFLELMYGKEGINEMKRVKKYLDPECILGRDNIFPCGKA